MPSIPSWNKGGGGSGTVKKVSSANSSVTVTEPTGPTVDIEVATSPKLGGTAAATYAKTSALPIIAETSATGVALTATVQTILTVTVPNDGKVHSLLALSAVKVISTALTGGNIALEWTIPVVGPQKITISGTAVGHTTASVVHASTSQTLEPGTTVTVKQTNVMTAGAAKVYAKIVII